MKSILDQLVADPNVNPAFKQILERQHHPAACPGCALCTTGDCKIDRTYPNAEDYDVFGRVMRPGT